MEHTIIKSLILFFSMPLINALVFGFSAIFKDVHEASISLEQFEAYEFSMITMIGLLAVTIPLFEGLFDKGKITNTMAVALYIGLFIAIALVTREQFAIRPREHIMTFLSVVSLLLTRTIVNRSLLENPIKLIK